MAYALGLGYIYNVYMLLLFSVLLWKRIYNLVLNIHVLGSTVFVQSLGTISSNDLTKSQLVMEFRDILESFGRIIIRVKVSLFYCFIIRLTYFYKHVFCEHSMQDFYDGFHYFNVHKVIMARVKKLQQSINGSMCPYTGMHICRDLGFICAGIDWCIYVCIYCY